VQFSGEIVSCDSVAVYRHFQIGTAKPSHEDRARVPHHLIDVAEPGEPFTAGEYARQGRAALTAIAQRGHLPIVVGGTGLYLRALLEGLFPGPQRSAELRERLRVRAAERGPGYLHRVLGRLDPTAAAKIHANDIPKLIRAIEVCLAARAPMSKLWRDRGRDPLRGFRILRIGLNPPRNQLYDRIHQRATLMFDNGLIAETQSLLQRFGDAPQTTPMHSLGYRQAVQHIRGELAVAQAVAAAQQGHRNYAKRQMTWFRREPDVDWLKGFGDDLVTTSHAAEFVNAALTLHSTT
jgi:tRNA dimethylallyltransferase